MTLAQFADSDLRALDLFRAGNDAGDGFAPPEDMVGEGWELFASRDSTDDVEVWLDNKRRIVLVGTDGTGSDDSRWAVRPE
jgi:hypothetical protein